MSRAGDSYGGLFRAPNWSPEPGCSPARFGYRAAARFGLFPSPVRGNRAAARFGAVSEHRFGGIGLGGTTGLHRAATGLPARYPNRAGLPSSL